MKNQNAPLPVIESVWDYPRPPRLESSGRRIRVIHAGILVAHTRYEFRIVETGHAPLYFVSPEDVKKSYLRRRDGTDAACPWKGEPILWDLEIKDVLYPAIARTFPAPTNFYVPIRNYFTFYPSRLEACFVDDEQVRVEADDIYGGWITDEIVGFGGQ